MKKNILSSISVVFVTLVIVASCKKPIGKCEELFEKGLCLPSGSNLTDDDRSRIEKVIFATLT